MKTLTNYTEKKVTAALERHGAFYAFGREQFEKKKAANIEYVSLRVGGLICPKENASELLGDLDRIHTEAIAEDVEENGLKAIVLRELWNHECFYTGEIDDAWEALKDYPGITEQLVIDIFNKNQGD